MLITWNTKQTRGETAVGHRILILSRAGTGVRVVQTLAPAGTRITELATAVEAGGDIAGQAQQHIAYITAREREIQGAHHEKTQAAA